MKFLIYCINENCPEAKAIEAFCKWQLRNYELIVDLGFVLKTNRGFTTPIVVIKTESDDVIVKGFFNFISCEENGMVLC